MSKEWTEQIPAESPLVNEQLKAQLKTIFERLERNITLVSIIDLDNGTCMEMASFLKSVASVQEKITVEFYKIGEDPQLDSLLNAELLPATGLFLDGNYQGVAFHGVPGGKEINSFVMAIVYAAGPAQPVEEKILKKLGKLKTQNNLKVCVSLSCHHCPNVVAAGQRLALLSPNVTCEMVDARLYPDLVEKYQISRVPAVILNDGALYLGEKDMEGLLALLK